MIHTLNGYWPDRSFEQLDPRWLLSPGPWVGAARLLGDWTCVLLGGLPSRWMLAAAAGAALVWVWQERGHPRRVAFGLGVVLGAAAVQTSMLTIMVARYEPVTWSDHRFWYYPLPYQALLVFAMLWGLERLAFTRGSLPGLVPVVLGTLVVANVAQWPERRYIVQSGQWFSEVERGSTLLVRSWRNGRAEPLLHGEYRHFYFETLVLFPRLEARAGAYVAEGNGVSPVQMRDGRLVGPARRVAHLPVNARRTGRHVLVGGVFLRPATTVSIWLGPRQLTELNGDPSHQGPLLFRITADLAAGRSDLILRARPPKDTGEGRRGFELALPFLVWRDDRAPLETFVYRETSSRTDRGERAIDAGMSR